MQLVLDTNGLSLSKRNGSFYITHKTKGRRIISPHRITSIAVIRDCMVSTAAIRLATKFQIPIHFCSATSKAEASVFSASYSNISTIRRQQVLWAEDTKGVQLVKKWYRIKTENQIKLIQKLSEITSSTKEETIAFLKQQSNKTEALEGKKIADIRNSMLGLEGSAAKKYWQTVSSSLNPKWQFKTRSRRPALDPFNCALNYLYGMTYNLVENAIRGAGLDPYFGFFHVDVHQQPTLVFDLIEPFRPWVDSFLIEQTKILKKANALYFENKNEGFWLSKEGRKVFIPSYNDFMNETIFWKDYKTSRKNHIHRFTSMLAQDFKNG